MQNYDASSCGTNPNQINVYYTPNAQQANFTYAYASNALHTPALPPTVTVMGGTDGNIAAPSVGAAGTASSSVIAPPVGYSISGYKAPNGQIYSSLSAALASQKGPSGIAGTFGITSNTSAIDTYKSSTNDFQVILTPDAHDATFNYVFSANTPGTNGVAGLTQATLPSAVKQSGVTGDVIQNPGIPTLTGYTATSVVGPNGAQFGKSGSVGLFTADLGTAITAFPYIYVSSASAGGNSYGLASNFTITYSANAQTGKVTYAYAPNVPGQNGVAGTTAPALPQTIALSGLTGAPLSFTAASIPSGYEVSAVIGPDGKSYNTLAEAKAANPYFTDASQSTNSFAVTLSASKQTCQGKMVWQELLRQLCLRRLLCQG